MATSESSYNSNISNIHYEGWAALSIASIVVFGLSLFILALLFIQALRKNRIAGVYFAVSLLAFHLAQMGSGFLTLANIYWVDTEMLFVKLAMSADYLAWAILAFFHCVSVGLIHEYIQIPASVLLTIGIFTVLSTASMIFTVWVDTTAIKVGLFTALGWFVGLLIYILIKLKPLKDRIGSNMAVTPIIATIAILLLPIVPLVMAYDSKRYYPQVSKAYYVCLVMVPRIVCATCNAVMMMWMSANFYNSEDTKSFS